MAPTLSPPNIAAGRLTLYKLYDVGYAIDLDKAQQRISAPTARRHPAQTRQANSIQIAQPPLRVELGMLTSPLGDLTLTGQLRASVFDLAVIVLVLDVDLPQPTTWDVAASLLWTWQDPSDALEARFLAALDEFEAVIRTAITRHSRHPIVEDYAILTVDRLIDDAPFGPLASESLVLAALLGESRPLNPSATRLVTTLSYFPDDLALLSWNSALIADPEPLAAATAADLIEFANVELLLMRTYDAQIDADLPRVYRRIAASRRRFALPGVRRYSLLLREVQELIVEVTEVTERVDNALKVTDDVYWNRLYSAALSVLQVDVWRQGVTHKLSLLRETYTMLHEDAEAERSTALEWIVILLIAFEIIWALLGRH